MFLQTRLLLSILFGAQVIAGTLGTKPVITAQLNASFNGPGLSSSVAFSVVTPSPAPYSYDTSPDDDDEALYGYEVPDESDSEDEYHPGSDSCTSVVDGDVSWVSTNLTSAPMRTR